MFKNLVFDFDGTIVDSGETVYRGVVESLQIKAPPFKELRKYPVHQIISNLEVGKLQLPKLILKARAEYKKFLPTLMLIEGMGETLTALRNQGARLFLCTSNSSENVEEFLRIQKLENTFEMVVGTLSLFGKSYGIKKTLKNCKLHPKETIYIGDEARDIQAAKKAGISCASVSWGFNERTLLETYEPDFIFDQAHELLKLVGR